MSVPEVDHFFDRTDSYGVYEVDVPCFRAVFPFLDLAVDEDVEGELARHETLFAGVFGDLAEVLDCFGGVFGCGCGIGAFEAPV